MSKPEPTVCDVDTPQSFQPYTRARFRMVHARLVCVLCENSYAKKQQQQQQQKTPNKTDVLGLPWWRSG